MFGASTFIMKSFFSCFLPIIVAVFFLIVFILWKLFWWKRTDFKWNVVVCMITILLFLHPSITDKAFSLLKCVSIYDSSWLQYDLEMVCWQGMHLYWGIGFAVPMVLLCFSFPAIGVFWMVINRRRLEN